MKLGTLTTLLAVLAIPSITHAQTMDMGGTPADKANMEAMQKMQQAMPKKGMGDPDMDFVTMMTPHHQGAIDMAKVEIQYGKDPMLKKMARKMIKDQEKEIAAMQAWQKKQGK